MKSGKSTNEQRNQLLHIPIGGKKIVLVTMVVSFTFYNYVVYTSGCENPMPPVSDQAMRGEELWQNNNCTACHQLYGLGGYLGPDLTNVISSPNKGPLYVKAFLNSGIKSMPKFHFSKEEQDDIVAFLSHVDQTGYFPNAGTVLQMTGWIELEYKTPNDVEDE